MKLKRNSKGNILTKHLFARVTEASDNKLQVLGDEYGLSKSHLVRVAIEEFLVKHSA